MKTETKKPKTPGWISFVLACVIYVLGYGTLTGSVPGVAGALKWWSILILFLLWGAVSAALEAIVTAKEKKRRRS